jgi:glyoxylase-like metal-dependent hydrolase (beta-lactamase superfamily II)
MAPLTEQVAQGVHRVADGIVNWYLVVDGDEVALYDAGWPRSWQNVQRALRQIGRSPSDLTAVLLTHGHPDHLGAAERVRRETGAKIHVHAPEAPRAHGEGRDASPFSLVPGLLPTLWRPSATAFVLEATARGFMFPTWVQELETFETGLALDFPGRPRAVATPGHTAGHVSFLLGGAGVVVTGDAIATLNVLTRARGPQLMPDQLNADPARTRASLEALAELPADTLLPGHGDPFRGSPRAAVEQARANDR